MSTDFYNLYQTWVVLAQLHTYPTEAAAPFGFSKGAHSNHRAIGRGTTIAGTTDLAVIPAPNRAENCRSEDLQGGGVFSVVVGLYDDVDVLIEGDEEAQKALHGELAEFAAQHFGDIGLADAEQGGGFDLFQAALFHDRIDLEDQLRLDEVFLGVGQA